MTCGIYKLTNTVNGKFYIGSAKDIDFRVERHFSNLRHESHCNAHLQRAWNQYGNVFISSVLEETDEQNLLIREQYYLDLFKPYLIDIGYNIGRSASGGDNLTSHPHRERIIAKMKASLQKRLIERTEEEKRLKSESMLGERNPNYGNKWSEEVKKRASENKKGIPFKGDKNTLSKKLKEWWANSENHAKMSDMRKGVGNGFYGKNHSEKSIEKMRHSQKSIVEIKRSNNQPLAPNSIAVTINDIKYMSATEAARAIGVNHTTIMNRVRSQNPKFGNYKFAEENQI